MTVVYDKLRMLNDEADDSPEKCRERRRRRIEMRRLAVSGAGSSCPETKENSESKLVQTGETSSREDEEALNLLPVFGTMSVAGRLREMEDAIFVRTNLCRPEMHRRQPVHFFGVYDGHGGPHVAALCRERMHVLMEEELMRVGSTGGTESGGGSISTEEPQQQQRLGLEEEAEEEWRKAMKRCFERMDEVAVSTCACGTFGCECNCHPMEVALAGSTAVVAILTPEQIVVANCGDSRAVLSRGGRAIPLSSDQKPDREDELARIESSGGKVIFVNGARVEGILAMSRAIGDKFLKPMVTSEPEISFTRRDPEDECLILASDGLWDVLSNDLACKVARECLQERNPAAARDLNARPRIEEDEGAGAFYASRSASAAALLTRLALGRKSSDNISVIVVDLKS